MSAIAQVVDGKLQQGTSTATTQKTSGSSLDKNAFLQLLVAQMKYQDPLQPTSNTEYISQLATFTELEEMQNLVANSDMQRASSLVGKSVVIKEVSDTGKESYVQGIVDYVVFENGKALLGVNGSEYSIDELDTVADDAYINALSMATAVVTALDKLPTVAGLTIQDKEAVDSIVKVYDEMDEYQKSFLTNDQQKLIESYRTRMSELTALAENDQTQDDAGTDNGDEGESTQN